MSHEVSWSCRDSIAYNGVVPCLELSRVWDFVNQGCSTGGPHSALERLTCCLQMPCLGAALHTTLSCCCLCGLWDPFLLSFSFCCLPQPCTQGGMAWLAALRDCVTWWIRYGAVEIASCMAGEGASEVGELQCGMEQGRAPVACGQEDLQLLALRNWRALV